MVLFWKEGCRGRCLGPEVPEVGWVGTLELGSASQCWSHRGAAVIGGGEAGPVGLWVSLRARSKLLFKIEASIGLLQAGGAGAGVLFPLPNLGGGPMLMEADTLVPGPALEFRLHPRGIRGGAPMVEVLKASASRIGGDKSVAVLGIHASASPKSYYMILQNILSDALIESEESEQKCDPMYVPIVRSGSWADIGFRKNMEDAYVCCDNFVVEYGLKTFGDGPNAFYGVFDGHGGKHAADFVCSNLLRLIIEDEDFPMNIDKVVTSAFLHADTAFAEACSIDSALASGTTALAALVIGRSLVVANAGDCRAVLCRRGKAIEMSRDHKSSCIREKKRIEDTGGYVYDGYLNGQLNIARALGDWHMEGMKGPNGLGPLSAEPELMKMKLTEEDEFIIIGCDGIWDVFRSQNAVDFARRKLQQHNDPATCCRDLVNEALKRKSSDNLAVVVVCFSSKPPPALATPKFRLHRSISAESLKDLQGILDSFDN